MLDFIILYLIFGTVWAWYGLNVYFYLRKLHEKEDLYQIPSIALNCILFPLGILLNKFIFIIKPNLNLIEKPKKIQNFRNDELSGIGFVIESLF